MYYAVSVKKILQKLYNNNSEAISCNCDAIKEAISSYETDATNLFDIYFAVNCNRDCRCGAEISSTLATTVANAALKVASSTDSTIETVSSAIMAVHAVGVSKSVASKVYSVAAGRIKSALTSNSLSLNNIPVVLDALAVFRQQQEGGPLHPELVADLSEKGFQLLPSGDGSFAADPLLLHPLSLLADKKLRLVGQRMIAVTESLLALRHSGDLATLSGVLQGLAYVSTYKFNPVHVALQGRSFPYGTAEKKLEVLVVDALGRPVDGTSVEAVSIKAVGASAASGAGREFFQGVSLFPLPTQTELHWLSLASEDLLPGKYAAALAASVKGHTKAVSFTGFFVISQPAAILSVAVGLADAPLSASKSSDLLAVAAPNDLTSLQLTGSAVSGDHLLVQWAVGGPAGGAVKKPHQSFVRLTNSASGLSGFFAGSRRLDADGGVHSYEASISLSNEMEKFGYQSGSYLLSIVVGDLTYTSSLEFVAGSLHLSFPAAPVVNLPLYAKSLLHASDVTLTKLPEITHVMRPPAKRASDLVALLFTALVNLPLLVLLVFLTVRLKPDLRRLSSPASVAFAGCILATLVLYVGYWLGLKGVSFYQTIYYLCVLAPVTAVVGSYSLASVKQMRLAQQGKE